MNRKRIITIAVVVIVVVGAFFGFRALSGRAQNAAADDFQTEIAQISSLEAYVGGTGTVHSNQNVTLTWETSGTVEVVNVVLGDEVTEGDVLASLYTYSLPQNVILAQADLVSAEDALEDFYDSYGPLALALAEQKVANARDALEDAEDEWEGIHYTGTDEEIEDAREAFWNAQDALDAVEEQFGKNSNRYRLAYQAYASALAHYNYVSGNTVDEIKEAQYAAALEVATQELADAEAEYERLLAGPNPADIAAAEARVAAAEATLEQAWIKSPISGVITLVEPMVGDQVSMGALAFRVDDLSRLLVDVQISEVDINRISVGQRALLSFDAILDEEYSGEVVEVSPVGTIDQGLVNFQVTIELLDADELIRPGMTAAVNIRVEQLEDVLLVPNRAVRAVEGQRVVYIVAEDGMPEMVEIELGATSDMYSEVIGGELSAGDEIILNPSTSFFGMMEGGPGGGPFGGN
jgi:HlyD family secretion protein